MGMNWTTLESTFAQTWLMLLLTTLVVIVVIAARVRRPRPPATTTYVAHVARLQALPRYRALIARRQNLAMLATIAALATCLGGIILAGRLQETRSSDSNARTRDIVLCLDASGSMSQVNASVIAEFQEIVDGLAGERIGMTIWDGRSITVFPLTDDYEFVSDELYRAHRAFRTEDWSYTVGTGFASAVSQIGDGLVSCVQRFDRLDEDRGRAIVLASDNQPAGKGIFTLRQAQRYAEEHDVVVHAVAAPHTNEKPEKAAEFERVVDATGGTYNLLGDDGSAGKVVDAINELEAEKIDKPPVIQVVDRAGPGRLVAGVGGGALLLVWAAQAAAWLQGRRATPTARAERSTEAAPKLELKVRS